MFPTTTGHPQQKGFGWIPTVYASQFLVKFYTTSILPKITNSDWSGEIANFGDEVIIPTVPDVKTHRYQKAKRLKIDVLDSEAVNFKINKGIYYNFLDEDVDKRMRHIDVPSRAEADAVMQIRTEIDRDGLCNMYADAHGCNRGHEAGAISGRYNLGDIGNPVVINPENSLKYLTFGRAVMDEANIGDTVDGRGHEKFFTVAPSWYCNMLLNNGFLGDASKMGDSKSILRTGEVGEIDDMVLYRSNNVPSFNDAGVEVFPIVFGHTCAVTFASQLVIDEKIRSEQTFGDLRRGLYIWGLSTVKPEALGVIWATHEG